MTADCGRHAADDHSDGHVGLVIEIDTDAEDANLTTPAWRHAFNLVKATGTSARSDNTQHLGKHMEGKYLNDANQCLLCSDKARTSYSEQKKSDARNM